ncbi:hypothetical protein [Dishui Lake virophage 2]|nr:hypothetical protein [Dishui Lake virophage 2]
MEKRTTNQLNNSVDDLIELFAVKGKYKLIGSNSLRSILYGSDYDVETQLLNNPASIKKHFQDAYKEAEKDPLVYITDFKCGWDERLKYEGDYSAKSLKKYLKNPLIPRGKKMAINRAEGEKKEDLVRELFILRWKPKDVEAGKIKLIDGTYKTMEECLLDPTTLKIDLIKQVGDQFCEISENYYIKTKSGKTNYPENPTKKLVEKGLEDDIRYYRNTNAFKALKRLFSLYLLEDKKSPKIDKMIDFFNGQVGYLNKIRAELEILEKVLTQDFRKPKWETIQANLQMIKEQLSSVFEIPFSEKIFDEIDKITEKSALKDIITLKDYFAKKINSYSKDFLANYI